MTAEYLAEKKSYYQKRAEYFENLDFNILANDFKGVVDLIEEVEKDIKENNNEQNGNMQ